MTDSPDITDSTILVTGGAGFIGSHIVDALLPENEVRVLDDLSSGNRDHVNPEARFIEGDVRDTSTVEAIMDGVDLVFHEAAVVSVEESVDNPQRSQEVNVGGTLNILEAARDEGARVILASSAAVYGHPEDVPVGESTSMAPTSPYGVDKSTVDHYGRLYQDIYGLETVVLRYFNVYGPRQSGGPYSGVISTFADQAGSGDALTIEGDGKQTRDFVHVDDVVAANLLAATTEHVGEAFNIGTGEQVEIRELAGMINEVFGGESAVTHVDPRPGDIRHSCADISKARSVLGYSPTYSLADGLRATFG